MRAHFCRQRTGIALIERMHMRVYLVLVAIALVAFALGMWDTFVQRIGDGWLMQTILPVLLIVVFSGLYMKARREREAEEEETEL